MDEALFLLAFAMVAGGLSGLAISLKRVIYD